MTDEPHDIEATVRYLTTEEGGRRMPVFSGYMDQFHFDDRDDAAAHYYPDVERVRPGETARSQIRFMFPFLYDGKLVVGSRFKIREGMRTVAEGVVDKIVDLPESARRARADSDPSQD